MNVAFQNELNQRKKFLNTFSHFNYKNRSNDYRSFSSILTKNTDIHEIKSKYKNIYAGKESLG